MTRYYHRCFACGEKAFEWNAKPHFGMDIFQMGASSGDGMLVCRACQCVQAQKNRYETHLNAWHAWTWKDVIVEEAPDA